jgi:hypothetical protein
MQTGRPLAALRNPFFNDAKALQALDAPLRDA